MVSFEVGRDQKGRTLCNRYCTGFRNGHNPDVASTGAFADRLNFNEILVRVTKGLNGFGHFLIIEVAPGCLGIAGT